MAYEAEVARYELDIADEPVIPATSVPFTINEPVMTALLINISSFCVVYKYYFSSVSIRALRASICACCSWIALSIIGTNLL